MAVRRLAEVQPDHFDFSPENRAWVDRQIKKYPPGRQASAVIALLRRAQAQHDGWLPKPAIEKVAEILDMPDIRVLEIATFYSMYNLAPVGRFFVQFCGTTPCVLRGADGIKAVLEQRIGPQGRITADGAFSWLEVECLGACCNAPMVQINDDYYEDLTPENFSTLLDDLAAGRPVRKGSQIGRHTSEPVGGLTSLTTLYGIDGREDRSPEDSPGPVDSAAARDEKTRQDTAASELPHGGREGEPRYQYGRQGGPVADTGKRTNDPVGAEQAESSARHLDSPQATRDRQEGPPTAVPTPKKPRSPRKPVKPQSGEG
jgi:NADH-quinone oxidoreductase subunit E